MWRFGVAVGISLLLGCAIRAQEGDTTSSIESMFTNHVELTNVVPIVDTAHRQLHVFNDGQWKTIPYPDDFMAVSFYESEDYDDLYEGYGSTTVDLPEIATVEGSLFLTEGLKNKGQGLRWVIDPKAGTLTRFQSQCSDGKRSNASGPWPSPVGWILVNTSTETHFCNTVTGRRVKLPHSNEWGSPSLSPDGRYLVFAKYASWDLYGNDPYMPTQLYSYDLEHGRMEYLGDKVLQLADYQDGLGWLTPTILGYRTRDMPEWSTVTYYTVAMGHHGRSAKL
jgi:hypothetical protein